MWHAVVHRGGPSCLESLLDPFLVGGLERPTDEIGKWLVDRPAMNLGGLCPVCETCVCVSAQRHVKKLKHRLMRTEDHSVLCLGNVMW
jgi:hypothetical protein